MNDTRPAGDERGGALFPGDGEMARRMRAHPWAETPQGDPQTWPASLTVLFAHADHIALVATPLLVPVLKISGLAQITDVRQADPGPEAAAR